MGLSAQRIYQDLVEEKGFADSYESVKRFVRKLRATHPQRVWRRECQPGEEPQLDFGLGGPIDGDQGMTRRSWILPFSDNRHHRKDGANGSREWQHPYKTNAVAVPLREGTRRKLRSHACLCSPIWNIFTKIQEASMPSIILLESKTICRIGPSRRDISELASQKRFLFLLERFSFNIRWAVL